MDHSPPPLFKQGASALAKMLFFAMIAIALLVVDTKIGSLNIIRQGIGAALYPFQAAALLPRDLFNNVTQYFSSLNQLRKENELMRKQSFLNSQNLQRANLLEVENKQLRKLLAASKKLKVKSILSEILYDARNPFSKKIVIDRGSIHGLTDGNPAIDDLGVVGQVTTVFPFTAEVTLLTDKDHAIPIIVKRSGVRSVAYGTGQSDELEIKFMTFNADIKKDDILITSGLDGIYPPGLLIAKVVSINRKSSDTFARIMCKPSAGISKNRQLLILLTKQKNFQKIDE